VFQLAAAATNAKRRPGFYCVATALRAVLAGVMFGRRKLAIGRWLQGGRLPRYSGKPASALAATAACSRHIGVRAFVAFDVFGCAKRDRAQRDRADGRNTEFGEILERHLQALRQRNRFGDDWGEHRH
jgi:hypothetical protein